VQLVAEGTNEELDDFLAEVQSAMRGYIRSAQIDTQSANKEFRGFEIRF
jgi:acylphosphatase